MEIRIANIEDAEAIRNIYAPYVINTAISFEYEVPSIEEFRERIRKTLVSYPYLVLIEDEKIVGYAYASPFKSRAAYIHSVELSVYVDMEYRRKGYGNLLYEKLIDLLSLQNVYMVHACIANSDDEDGHLSNDSELFHSCMGFKLAGKHEKCGYKFGKWYNIVWMDKVIKEKIENPENFIPFSKLTHKD